MIDSIKSSKSIRSSLFNLVPLFGGNLTGVVSDMLELFSWFGGGLLFLLPFVPPNGKESIPHFGILRA